MSKENGYYGKLLKDINIVDNNSLYIYLIDKKNNEIITSDDKIRIKLFAIITFFILRPDTTSKRVILRNIFKDFENRFNTTSLLPEMKEIHSKIYEFLSKGNNYKENYRNILKVLLKVLKDKKLFGYLFKDGLLQNNNRNSPLNNTNLLKITMFSKFYESSLAIKNFVNNNLNKFIKKSLMNTNESNEFKTLIDYLNEKKNNLKKNIQEEINRGFSIWSQSLGYLEPIHNFFILFLQYSVNILSQNKEYTNLFNFCNKYIEILIIPNIHKENRVILLNKNIITLLKILFFKFSKDLITKFLINDEIPRIILTRTFGIGRIQFNKAIEFLKNKKNEREIISNDKIESFIEESLNQNDNIKQIASSIANELKKTEFRKIEIKNQKLNEQYGKVSSEYLLYKISYDLFEYLFNYKDQLKFEELPSFPADPDANLFLEKYFKYINKLFFIFATFNKSLNSYNEKNDDKKNKYLESSLEFFNKLFPENGNSGYSGNGNSDYVHNTDIATISIVKLYEFRNLIATLAKNSQSTEVIDFKNFFQKLNKNLNQRNNKNYMNYIHSKINNINYNSKINNIKSIINSTLIEIINLIIKIKIKSTNNNEIKINFLEYILNYLNNIRTIILIKNLEISKLRINNDNFNQLRESSGKVDSKSVEELYNIIIIPRNVNSNSDDLNLKFLLEIINKPFEDIIEKLKQIQNENKPIHNYLLSLRFISE